MKKLLIALLLGLSGPAYAQPSPPPAAAATAPASRPPLPGADRDANPALWVVRDADTTIYLFGTIHLLDGRTWFNDEVRTAFDSADELVLEARAPENPAALRSTILRFAVDPRGRTISSRLDLEQNAALNRALQGLGVPPGAFDRFEPWFVTTTLTTALVQQLGMSGTNGPEAVLTRAAQARNIPIGELEGMEFQIRLFDEMPEDLQLTQLRQSLAELDRMGAMIGPMIAAWSSGDVERFAAITNGAGRDDAGSRALHRLIFTSRNNMWAGWIRDRLTRPGTVFVAVGAGHLAGPDSVQRALRRLGIRSARVRHVSSR